MSVVVDASVVIAAFTGAGPIGAWANTVLRDSDLAAPHLLPSEVTNVLRRQVARGSLAAATGALALHELSELSFDLMPFAPFQTRVWALRENLTAYDAWYVAVAEGLDWPLATLDQRLVTATGPQCEFWTP
jgi:predicted nucleic acid-binding protein